VARVPHLKLLVLHHALAGHLRARRRQHRLQRLQQARRLQVLAPGSERPFGFKSQWGFQEGP
jgi:hypothetical protein